jgi:hypothetical protein
MRKYHVVVIVTKTGKKVQMTSSPVSHDEACTILSKLTKHSWRTETLEEIA